MKRKFLSSLLLISITLFTLSCSKDDDGPENQTTQIAGLWIGTYTVNQLPQQSPLYYSFVIKPDGKLLTEGVGANGKTYYSKGTWALDGNTFTATYTTFNYDGSGGQVTQSATLTFNNSGSMTNGTWLDVVNPNGGTLSGTFPIMSRVD